VEARGRDRHLAAHLAESLDVTAHWLRALRRREERGEPARPKGRPRLSQEERARVRALVCEQLHVQGNVGWRDVLEGIRRKEVGREKPTSTMLVQQETAALKERARSNRRRALEAVREGHEVLARDAVWAQDATHVGRLESGEEVQAEVATDRATTTTVIVAAGPPASGEDLLGHLARGKEQRGGLPLVWQSDEGSANTSAAVAQHLEAEQVIHLRSRVHTPTDNPVAEHKNRELKEESGLGKGVRLEDSAAATARLDPARQRIDEGRLRASRGWRTAAELDRELPRADSLVSRAQFYAEARTAMREAVLGLTDPKAIRKAEQDAIWDTLERHGLARRHVGLRRTPCPRLDPVAPQRERVECLGGRPG
jgi:transposase InsO family protein